MTRRRFLAAALGGPPSPPVVVRVNVMFDRGVRQSTGLNALEIETFHRLQRRAQREYAVSGVAFELHVRTDAYLREQGYSEIPSQFLDARMLNLFVTLRLGYDIDRDRTGGSSKGPTPRRPPYPGDPYFRTYLGLRDAGEATLLHEYSHHLTLDTTRNPTIAANVWTDLRNDYWLWRQRRGTPIPAFRACAHSAFASTASRNESFPSKQMG